MKDNTMYAHQIPSFHCVLMTTAKVVAALALIGVSLAVAAFAVLLALALLVAVLA